MCKVDASAVTNPNFLLYNLVFSSSLPGGAFDAGMLHTELGAYGVEMSERAIRGKLVEWHGNGLLRSQGDRYLVA